MELINKNAEDYAKQFSSSEEPLLAEIADYTNQFWAQDAVMLSGHVQGKILEMISCLMQPKRILEIGTFTGYSAIALAKGLQEDGKLYTLELRPEDGEKAQGFFSKSFYNKKIILRTGNALEIIPTLGETWDIVFIDADKTGYIDYYELTLPLIRQNGLIIADNVLFHGEVLDNDIKGKNAKAIDAFNRHVAKDNRTEKVILTVRDGLFLIRKL